METGQCINEWCAACEWPAERPAQLREWLDCVRDLTVADDADIDRIAAAVSTSFLGRKAFKEHVRVLAARVERGEGPYDRPSSKPKRKPPPKRKAPPAKKKKPPTKSKKPAPRDSRIYGDDDLLLRPTYVAKAAAEAQAQKPKRTSGRCDRCDGLHKTEDCPYFSRPREEVVVVAASSTRVAAIRTGPMQCINQIVATHLRHCYYRGFHAIGASSARRRGGEVSCRSMRSSRSVAHRHHGVPGTSGRRRRAGPAAHAARQFGKGCF